MAGEVRKVERVIGRLATRAHGVVTRVELLDAEVTKAEIDQRVGTGALISVFRGVYRVGHRAPSVEARYMAAVKACGQGAVLSGLAAAHLFGLVKGPAPAPEVTAPDRAPGQGRQDPETQARQARPDQMARDPGHDRATHTGGSVLIAVVR
jgi:hypothetical protein